MTNQIITSQENTSASLLHIPTSVEADSQDMAPSTEVEGFDLKIVSDNEDDNAVEEDIPDDNGKQANQSASSKLPVIKTVADLLKECEEIKGACDRSVKQASIARAEAVVKIGRLDRLAKADKKVADLIHSAAADKKIRTRKGETTLFHIIAKLVFGSDARTASCFSVVYEKSLAAGIGLNALCDYILANGGVDSLSRTKKRGKGDDSSSSNDTSDIGAKSKDQSRTEEKATKSAALTVVQSGSVSEQAAEDGPAILNELDAYVTKEGDMTLTLSAGSITLVETIVSAEHWDAIKSHGFVIELKCGERSFQVGPITLAFQTQPLTETDILDA